MKIHFEPNPDAGDMDFLERQLFRFNAEKIHGYVYQDFLLRSLDPSGRWIAGLHGQVGGGWLYIAALWVAPVHRGNGMGRQLVCSAEDIALKKGCTGVYLYSYSFQNPGFYERLGYRVFGVLENFCGNNTKYFMKKEI